MNGDAQRNDQPAREESRDEQQSIAEPQLREKARSAPDTYPLASPFPAVDAGLKEYFARVIVLKGFRAHHVPQSSGSVRVLIVEDRTTIGAITARALDNANTKLSIDVRERSRRAASHDPEWYRGALIVIMERFVLWFNAELRSLLPRAIALGLEGGAKAEQPAAQPEQKPTYKEVYTRYKRRHAKNPKITIRDVCEEMGVDYDNIRAAKYRATKQEKPTDKRHKDRHKRVTE